MNTKICSRCKQEKNIEFFTKNKNTKDGFSYYCKDCAKQQQLLSNINKNYEDNDKNLIEILRKEGCNIEGLDKNKVVNTVIHMNDLPQMFGSIWENLPPFLKKYDWTYEEYIFFIEQCKQNKWWIS